MKFIINLDLGTEQFTKQVYTWQDALKYVDDVLAIRKVRWPNSLEIRAE